MATRLYRDEAIVLRTQDLGEADRIITMYSKRHGKIRGVAKGVRKSSSRFGARVEPFSRIDVQLHRGKSLDVISQVVALDAYGSRIAADYQAYTVAAALAEVIDRLTDHEADLGAAHYTLLHSALHALVTGARPAPLILDAFILRSLAMVGWAPQLRDCAVCGASGPHPFFSPQQGGMVCAECRERGARRISVGASEHMIFLLAGHWDQALEADGSVALEAASLIAWSLSTHLEKELRTLDLVDRTLNHGKQE